jgi:predicted metal-dependent hydrolase
VPVVLRHSPRARRVALRLRATDRQVELVLPQGAPIAPALRFLESRRDWLIDRVARLEAPIPFIEGARIPVLGRERRLCTGTQPGLGSFHLTEEAIEVFARPEHVARRTRDGLAKLAGTLLRRHALHFAELVDRRVTGIAIGDPKSRWGSCSSRGRLRFSWRLVLGPESVLRYVAAHEAAHLVHMNHSPAFWRVVEGICPGYEAERAWLKQNGASLMRYG